MSNESVNPFIFEGEEGEGSFKQEITTISMSLPMGMGKVNCYLVKNHKGFFLIDTGLPRGEKQLLEALEKAGCKPGDLKLIILTHYVSFLVMKSMVCPIL